MQKLKKDHLQHLSKFLDPIDIIQLGRALLVPIPKNVWLWRLITKIDDHFREHFGKHYNTFVTMMKQSQTCVSGSFLLQMILLRGQEMWDSSDIDFYAPNNGRPSWDIFLRERYQTEDYVFNEAEKIFYKMHYWIDSLDGCNYTHAGMQIDMVREYSTVLNFAHTEATRSFIAQKFKKFQIISLNNAHSQQDIFNFVVDTFDFPMLMNIFYYDDRGCPKIKINDLKTVFSKTVIVNEHCTALNSIVTENRKIKYINRGFKFPDNCV